MLEELPYNSAWPSVGVVIILVTLAFSILMIYRLKITNTREETRRSIEKKKPNLPSPNSNAPELQNLLSSRTSISNTNNRLHQPISVNNFGSSEENVLSAQAIKKQEKKEAKNAEREMNLRAREEKEKKIEERKKKIETLQKQKDELRNAKEQEEIRRQEIKSKEEEKEYEQWKDMLSIIEVGQSSNDTSENLESFASYINKAKFVSLSTLVEEFHLKTKDILERIQDLEQFGYISGVFDDRGRYVSITYDEFYRLAEFINHKGRISKTDLISGCNRIINLESNLENKIMEIEADQ